MVAHHRAPRPALRPSDPGPLRLDHSPLRFRLCAAERGLGQGRYPFTPRRRGDRKIQCGMPRGRCRRTASGSRLPVDRRRTEQAVGPPRYGRLHPGSRPARRCGRVGHDDRRGHLSTAGRPDALGPPQPSDGPRRGHLVSPRRAAVTGRLRAVVHGPGRLSRRGSARLDGASGRVAPLGRQRSTGVTHLREPRRETGSM